MKKEVYVIHPDDNTGTVISSEVSKGKTVQYEVNGQKQSVQILKDIPYGHKIAVRNIRKGEAVLKYGLSIGSAVEDIKQGDHVHVHNIESNRGRGDLHKEAAATKEEVNNG